METMDAVEVMEDVEVESCYALMEVNVDTPKKRKTKAQEETVVKPKKPRSAYLLYYFDVHQLMQKDCPNMPQSEINKCISERWKRLNVTEKAYYLEKAKLEKMGICTSSLVPSQHVPGFRKIFPRANYVLQAEGSQPEATDSPEDRGQPPETQCPALALASEVEQCIAVEGLAEDVRTYTRRGRGRCLAPGCSFVYVTRHKPLTCPECGNSEQCIAVEGLAEAMATMSHPASSTASIMVPAVSQCSDSAAEDGLLLRGSESRVVGSSYGVVAMAPEAGSGGRPMVQRMQGETTQVVIIPTQNLLEFQALSGDVGPVMMASVGTTVEQSLKSSYKMDVRTYTRRGRGRCLAPGCSFVYVTRHKPLTCPECGNHLGGKWVPGAKKAQVASKQQDETPSSDSCQSTKERNVAAINATNNTSEDGKEGGGPQAKKQRVVAAGIPTEGSRTKSLKPPAKGAAVSNVPKKPVRPILPACPGRAVFIVPIDNNRSNPGGLKPNTLKQLGQTTSAKQNSHILDGNVASLLDKRVNMNIMPVIPFKQNTISSFDLGLSTARGRGRCKNPRCDYVYKNRHKPAKCPNCGWELSAKNSKSVDPYKAISLAQKELQRQSTVQLLRRVLQIPESEAELRETLALIQELNSPQVVLTQSGDQLRGEGVETETILQSSWPRFYESAATQCGLCHYPLFKGGQSTVAGQEDCWLLTETLIQTASLQLKVCPNTQCLALHSFTDLHPGLFNIGNRLLVSVDLLLKIRAQIKLGHHPSQAVRTLLDHVPNHPVHVLSPEESSRINELLLSGYWAFECLTVRDYNDMICGLCGIAPKLEMARRYTQDALELRNVEFTWPECSASDEVHVDDFWLTMESEAIEQAAFPSDIPITRVDASIVAPFIPPLMRSPAVINTEKDKVLSHPPEEPSGDPSMLVRLIHEGQLRPEKIEEHSEMELRTMLNSCGLTTAPDCSKIELLNTLISLYARVQNGLSTAPQPPQNLTAGKLSKFCPHKVLCGSKYMVRGETARDHVDLLLSSRYWPPVYVTDAARSVALCADMQYPELATQMWGRNQGCFSDPFEQPEFVSCAELQDQPYGGHLSSLEDNQSQQLHPITKSSSRWLVHPSALPAGPPGAQEEPPAFQHHSMGLCKELEPYTSLVARLEKEEEESSEGSSSSLTGARQQQQPVMSFSNPAYYYLYNRLVDFLGSRDVVSQQISQVLKACQPGEVVIRDALYRLGVAQINAEEEEEAEGVEGAEGQEEGVRCREAVYEVVVP